MKTCKVCGKEITNNNKKYCCLDCRYRDSHFKTYSYARDSKDPDKIEKIKKAAAKAADTRKRKFDSGEITIWNKGLTRETSESLRNIGDSRKGKDNPIHKILNDPDKKKDWISKIQNGSKEEYARKRGKKYEEIYGEEISKEIKERIKKGIKKNPGRGFTGKSHTEETKRKIAEKTAKQISDGKLNRFTEPMRLFKKMVKLNKIKDVEVEFFFGRYCLDFAIVNMKIAIEIDGDFYHSNPNMFPNGPIHEIQKHNQKNDKAKEEFLKNQGWKIIRFWEYDIKNNIEEVELKFKKFLRENQNESCCV